MPCVRAMGGSRKEKSSLFFMTNEFEKCEANTLATNNRVFGILCFYMYYYILVFIIILLSFYFKPIHSSSPLQSTTVS